jgi:hypothetical protein
VAETPHAVEQRSDERQLIAIIMSFMAIQASMHALQA